MKEKLERNEWLDIAKLVAAFFVVCIHIRFSGDLGVAFNAAGRFAVPLFFSVSGFFVLNADIKTVKRRLVKILILYLIAAAVYHAEDVLVSFYKGGFSASSDYLSDTFLNPMRLMKFLIFNEDLTTAHLWFLPALIYVYIVWMLVIRFSVSDTVVFVISALCLLLNLIFGEILSPFGVSVENIYIRNFALMGFPFFAFGYLIRKHKGRLVNIKSYALILMIVLGTAEAVISALIFGINEMYVGSICCWFGIMILSVKKSDAHFSPKLLKLGATTTDIYVYHVLISRTLIYVMEIAGVTVDSVIFVNLWPLALFPICVGFSLLKNNISACIKHLVKARKA